MVIKHGNIVRIHQNIHPEHSFRTFIRIPSAIFWILVEIISLNPRQIPPYSFERTVVRTANLFAGKQRRPRMFSLLWIQVRWSEHLRLWVSAQGLKYLPLRSYVSGNILGDKRKTTEEDRKQAKWILYNANVISMTWLLAFDFDRQFARMSAFVRLRSGTDVRKSQQLCCRTVQCSSSSSSSFLFIIIR